MDASTERVTYATLAAGETDQFRQKYDDAVVRIRRTFGRRYGHQIDGEELLSDLEFEDLSPSDTRIVIGRVATGGSADIDRAVESARRGCRDWSRRPWQERVTILRRAADIIEARGFDLSALVSIEAGKSRMEAMGDVTETADLARYYCQQMADNDGFDIPMARLRSNEETRSVMRPYGVWAVISPFNFPAALVGGPVSAALVAGNAVVLKPSHETPLTALALYDAFRDAGVPTSALHVVLGAGAAVGEALANHPGVDGLLFTGSKAVGMSIYNRFSKAYPKPCITEMGGKNPTIVMDTADVDAAAEGVLRSAFGLQGQKCSACSRVYVHRAVKNAFLEALVERTNTITIGDPSSHGVFLGPVIHRRAHDQYQDYAGMARRDGDVRAGGRVLTEGELAHGFFVAPTVVDGLAHDHFLFKHELFVPLVCIATVDGLDEALTLANDSEYGLTAGFFSGNDKEIEAFAERIEAGVIYINRRAGATTGAWPGVQPFGGWKASGSSGKASGGPYYVQQFMREQSRTFVR